MTEPFYVSRGEGFVATAQTRGPWDPGTQHAGPVAALLGRALEACEPREDARIARVTYEILRPVPIAALDVETSVVRAGRSVELLSAVLSVDGRAYVRAHAWRLRTEAIGAAVPPTGGPSAGPDATVPARFFETGQDVGWHTAMEIRFARGQLAEPGPATAWFRMGVPLVDDEAPSPLVRLLVAADAGNGVSAALDFAAFMFVNTDLTVNVHRLPRGEWVCLDAVTVVEPDGIGLAHSRLADTDGWIGHGLQTLFIAPR